MRNSRTKHDLIKQGGKIEKDTIQYKSVSGRDSIRHILYSGRKSKSITYFEDGNIERVFTSSFSRRHHATVSSFYYPNGNLADYYSVERKKKRHGIGFKRSRYRDYSYYANGKIKSLYKRGFFRPSVFKDWDENGKIIRDAPNIADIRSELFYNVPFDSTTTFGQIAKYFEAKSDSFSLSEAKESKVGAEPYHKTYYRNVYLSTFAHPVFNSKVKIELSGSKAWNKENITIQYLRITPIEDPKTKRLAKKQFKKIAQAAGLYKIKSTRERTKTYAIIISKEFVQYKTKFGMSRTHLSNLIYLQSQ